MAGRGRGSDQGEDAIIGVSERSLFAASAVPCRRRHRAWRRGPATAVAGGCLGASSGHRSRQVVRLRRQLRRLSLPGLRHSVVMAAGLELDRGIAFLLVPVFLACGAIVYFSLAAEPDFPKPIAVVVLTALCALVSRSWPKTHLCFMAALLCALGLLAAKVETWRAGTRMLGSEISTQADRPCRLSRPDGERPHPADHRRDRRPPGRNCAMHRSGFGFRREEYRPT